MSLTAIFVVSLIGLLWIGGFVVTIPHVEIVRKGIIGKAFGYVIMFFTWPVFAVLMGRDL